MKCRDCPRACGADRDADKIGACHGGALARIAKIIEPFEYEEPCLGKVTAVFFGGCALGCSYCQNYEISRGGAGREYTDAELARVFDNAAYPLDLVTPSHYLKNIEHAVDMRSKNNGVIYNTSGYETADAVTRAARFTSVFLTDYKYSDEQTGRVYSHAPDYHAVALAALEKMRDIPDEWTDGADGKRILTRGLIVRHLVLPGHVQNSIKALDNIAAAVGTDVVLSLMSQFTPNGVGEPSAKLNRIEYKIVVEHALKLGFKNGYIQEFSSADKKYTPKF